MPVTPDNIHKVATLARIAILPEDMASVTDSINKMLGLIDCLQQVDTTGIEPLNNPHDAQARLRADEVTAINQREKLQQNAPAFAEGHYLVPKVID